MNKRQLLTAALAALLILFSQSLTAQEAAEEGPKYGWQNELLGGLNFTQTSFSNPVQGGEDSWNWQLNINGKFVDDQEKFNWANTANITYGRTKVGDDDDKKSSDEIRLESVFTYKMGVYVNPYVSATAQTQFTAGYNFATDPKTEISNIFDPAYFTESVGLGYEPFKNFKTRLGAALKQTIADKFAAAYSDDAETLDEIETLRSEVGVESVTDFSDKISENIVYTTKLSMFSNVKGVNEIDVRWDNLVSAQVSKFLAVSFTMKLFYDRDISLKREIQQVLAAGLTYSFL